MPKHVRPLTLSAITGLQRTLQRHYNELGKLADYIERLQALGAEDFDATLLRMALEATKAEVLQAKHKMHGAMIENIRTRGQIIVKRDLDRTRTKAPKEDQDEG